MRRAGYADPSRTNRLAQFSAHSKMTNNALERSVQQAQRGRKVALERVEQSVRNGSLTGTFEPNAAARLRASQKRCRNGHPGGTSVADGRVDENDRIRAGQHRKIRRGAAGRRIARRRLRRSFRGRSWRYPSRSPLAQRSTRSSARWRRPGRTAPGPPRSLRHLLEIVEKMRDRGLIPAIPYRIGRYIDGDREAGLWDSWLNRRVRTRSDSRAYRCGDACGTPTWRALRPATCAHYITGRARAARADGSERLDHARCPSPAHRPCDPLPWRAELPRCYPVGRRPFKDRSAVRSG